MSIISKKPEIVDLLEQAAAANTLSAVCEYAARLAQLAPRGHYEDDQSECRLAAEAAQQVLDIACFWGPQERRGKGGSALLFTAIERTQRKARYIASEMKADADDE